MAWIWFGLFAFTLFALIGALLKVAELEKQLGIRPPKPASHFVRGLAGIAPEDDARWFEDERGAFASFTYIDADGVVTERQVRNWRSDGRYVRGYCLVARNSRTFRKDRIEDWTKVGG